VKDTFNEYETQFLVKGSFKFKTAFKIHYETGRYIVILTAVVVN
jgi:hypothetical protein